MCVCDVFGSCTIKEGGVFPAYLKKMLWSKFSLTKTRRQRLWVANFGFASLLLLKEFTWKEWLGLGFTKNRPDSA